MMNTRGYAWLDAFKVAVLAVCFTAAMVCTVEAQDQGAVCWKPTYGRGVGTIPGECGPGQSKESGLCYSACPAGSSGVLAGCHQNCPAGFGSVTPIDASCSKPAKFPRNAYPVASAAQCTAESAGRGCEQIGTALYVKPPAGVACEGPICQASCPAGMTDTGGACRKQPALARGVGTIPQCGSGGEPQVGLCYKSCNAGFGGAGPVCWGQCPASQPVDCGAMCATHSSQCAAAVANQVISVLDFTVTVVETVVTAGGALGVRTAIGAAEKAALESSEAAITAAAKLTAKAANKALIRGILIDQAKGVGQALTEGQILNLTAMASGEKFDFTSLDPSGIAAMVAAYNKPICNVAPGSNVPVIANPRLAGQVFKSSEPGGGLYLVGPTGIKHKIYDERFPLSKVLQNCGIVGAGDISPDGSSFMIKGGNATYPCCPGLQPATGAALLPRGKDLDNNECRGMAEALRAIGKFRFVITR